MSETQPHGHDCAILEDLRERASQFYDADNELLYAIGRVILAFLEDYETEDDTPECPQCDDPQHPSHGRESFHVRCDEPVRLCRCLAPYLLLAGRAPA